MGTVENFSGFFKAGKKTGRGDFYHGDSNSGLEIRKLSSSPLGYGLTLKTSALCQVFLFILLLILILMNDNYSTDYHSVNTDSYLM